MQPAFVTVHYSRHFPFPVERAFAWLTDYQDDDPSRTTAVQKGRRVIDRTKDKITMEGDLEMLGARGKGVVEVRLDPPDHWIAEIVKGGGRGSIYDYKLTPEGHGCRIDVAYKVRVKRWSSRIRLTFAKPIIRRELHVMWNGFAAAMETEMTAAAKASP